MTPLKRTLITTMLGCSLVTISGCPEEEDDQHGYVKIQLRRAENQSESPFGGTDTIQAIINYDTAQSQCLEEFYGANPNWLYDGLDGGEVFQDWMDNKICGGISDADGPIDCESATVTQDFRDVPTLKIVYNGVSQPLENHVLIVGPLPTADLAVCEGGVDPTVRITAPNVTGRGGGGTQVWSGLSAPVDKAATGQGAPMKVNVQRVGT